MSKSILDKNLNLLNNNDHLQMIPLAKFKLKKFTGAITLEAYSASTHINDLEESKIDQYRINSNHLTDYIYFYNVKRGTMCGKIWIHEDDSLLLLSDSSESEIYVLAYPYTIYKLQHLCFKSNPYISEVYDLYTFNMFDYSNIFKDCYNITSYDTFLSPTNLTSYEISINEPINFNYAFSNNFKATKLPSRPERDYVIRYAYINYMFMNTTKLNEATLLDIDGGEIYLRSSSANGAFFNSNIDPNIYSYLQFGSIHEFRNTFAGMTNDMVIDMTIRTNSAVSLESTFRDNNTYNQIKMNFYSYLYNMNNTFKGAKMLTDIIQLSTYMTFNLNFDEMIGTFADCKSLTSTPTNIELNNTLKIACDIYKNCESLTNDQFIAITPTNVLIFSGIYNGCSKFTDPTVIDGYSSSLNLYNVYIVNDLFRNCKSLKNPTRSISFGTTPRNIYVDGMYAMSGIQSSPTIFGCEYIVSSAEMLRNTEITSFNFDGYTNTKDISAMFMDCKKLTNTVNFPNAIIATNLYANCPLITSAIVNITNPRYMVGTFKNCNALTTITSNTKETCQVKDVSNLFEGCNSLASYNNIINTENAETLVNMFKGCTNLTNVSLNLNGAKNTKNMFYGCINLNDCDLSLNQTTPAPYISMRGTSLTVETLTKLIDALPDVYRFVVDNPTDVLTNVTWKNGSYNLFRLLYPKTFISTAFTLKPGVYTITENKINGYNFGVSIISQTTGEIMNAMTYNDGYDLKINVNIPIEDKYFVIINTDYTTNPPISIRWSSPIYKLDIRNIPALNNLSSELISNANEKGWQVLYGNTDTIDNISSDNETDNYNFMETITSSLIDDNKWSTEPFVLNKGYYTLYSKNHNNNNFKVYKIVDSGEYPIAMSYDDSLVCFEINDDTNIKIIFNNENIDIELLKS